MFERDETIYKNRNVLEDDYQPTEFVGREKEIQEYKELLKPIIDGWQPNNIFLYGKTGVGKTAVTKYLLKHLEKDAKKYDDIKVNIIFQNCEGLKSSYQVAGSLVNKLRNPQNQINKSGYSLQDMYGMLWNEIDKIGGTIILVLDEIDHIRKEDSIFYQLSRARENNNIENARLGIIGISNDFSFRDTLSPKVKSSLCEKELQFPAYDAEDLKKILGQRAEKAFYKTKIKQKQKTIGEGTEITIDSKVLDYNVIDLCAAYGAKNSGDARQALDLLMEAGDIAVNENEEKVIEKHVESGKTELERGRVEEGIAGLTDHAHIILYTLLTFELDNKTPIRSRGIRPRYTDLSKRFGENPISSRSMRDHLGELAMVGVADVRERNEGKKGGSYREYSLNMSDEVILSALKKTSIGDNLDIYKPLKKKI